MTTAEVLAACRAGGVSLRLVDGAMRQSGAGPELLAELKSHREDLLAIVQSPAWPWLGFAGFELGAAVCACGRAPWVFAESGEPLCKVHVPNAALDSGSDSVLI